MNGGKLLGLLTRKSYIEANDDHRTVKTFTVIDVRMTIYCKKNIRL